MKKKNLFIIGLDEFNKQKLERLPQAEYCSFSPALEVKDFRNVDRYDMDGLIDKAVHTIESTGDPIDGIASYWDFPGTLLAAILADHFTLPGPSVESMFKCEHKYWSRLEQQKVIPDHIPRFQVFSAHADNAYQSIDLLPPYWIKPIKSFRSYLAFRINSERHFREAMEQVRPNVAFMVEPFQDLMKRYKMPPEIADLKENCIAESTISGWQCTLEGYVVNNGVVIYGIVDSICELDRSSFARYEYPSTLPLEIQHRMMDVGRAAIQQIGLNFSAFNIEFYYNQTDDEVYLLEINPRISQAHSDIFEKVHGTSHHQIMVDLALGRKPQVMEKRGEFNVAGNFMLRTYEHGTVKKIPTRDQIDSIKNEHPGTIISLSVTEGQHLKELPQQDSYSYEIGNIFIGGRDQTDMLRKYDSCLERLRFQIERDEESLL